MSDTALAQAIRVMKAAPRVVYVCGAGLSVPSGIRAYRTGPNAVWDTMVTEWGTTAKFFEDPVAWWKTFWLGAHGDLERTIEPNEGHRALAALMARHDDDLVVTQNIDGLHRRAQHLESRLIEIHGRHDRFICADPACEGYEAPVDTVDLSRLEQGHFPTCGRCGGPMRPLVLLFDELYDSHSAYQAHRARRAMNETEVMVFVGTSFSVGITSYALHCADASAAKCININVEGSGRRGFIDLVGGAQEFLPRLLAGVLG